MIDASNSDNGIGLSQNDAASHISSLLDSNLDIAATDETGDVENETDEVSTPSDDAFETSDEQFLGDSDDLVEAAEDEAAVAEVAPFKISDDSVFDLDGETITGKQWKEANLRYADYTRKTQELADARRGVDTQVDDIRGQTIAYLRNMERDLSMYLPQEPDWASLAKDFPADYVVEKEKWAAIHAQIGNLRQERANLEQQEQARAKVQHEAALREGSVKLAEMHPELSKKETGRAQALFSYAGSRGVSAEQFNSITNPEWMSMVYESMLYRELQSQKAKAVKVVDAKPPLTTPGSSPARSNSSQSVVERKMSALKRTGSQAAAADVLKHLL